MHRRAILPALAMLLVLLSPPLGASAAPARPNVAVTTVTLAPGAIAPGATIRATVSIRSSGTAGIRATSTQLLLSRDRSRGTDVVLARLRTAPLAHAARRTLTTTVVIPAATAPGAWFVLACADANAAVRESSESDNCRAASLVVDAPSPAVPPAPAPTPTPGFPTPLPGTPPTAGTVTLTGSFTVGEQVHAVLDGFGVGSPLGTTTLRWRRCNALGGACVDIAGATDADYVLAAADLDSRLQVVASIANACATGCGSAAATSVASEIVGGIAPTSGTATIAGTASVGQQLSAVAAGFGPGNPPSPVALQWRRCSQAGTSCVDIAGAVAPTYSLVAGDVDATLRVVATAANACLRGCASVSATSPATPVVAGTAPVAGTASLSGAAIVGSSLAVGTVAAAAGVPASTPTFQWQRCNGVGASCLTIAETSDHLVLGAADVDHTIIATVTRSNACATGCTTVSASTSASAVVAGTTPIAGSIAVSGVPQPGQTLTATRQGAVDSVPSAAVTWEWLRCQSVDPTCTNPQFSQVGPANTYLLTSADLGWTIAARVIVQSTCSTGCGSTQATSPTTPLVYQPFTVLDVDTPRAFARTPVHVRLDRAVEVANVAFVAPDGTSLPALGFRQSGADVTAITPDGIVQGTTYSIAVTRSNGETETTPGAIAMPNLPPVFPTFSATPNVVGTASPSVVSLTATTSTSLTWAYLDDPATVQGFDNYPVHVRPVGSTSAIIDIPAGIPAGTYQLTLVSTTGTAYEMPNAITVQAGASTPRIEDVMPHAFAAGASGQSLTITGSGFTAPTVTSACVGGQAAPTVAVGASTASSVTATLDASAVAGGAVCTLTVHDGDGTQSTFQSIGFAGTSLAAASSLVAMSVARAEFPIATTSIESTQVAYAVGGMTSTTTPTARVDGAFPTGSGTYSWTSVGDLPVSIGGAGAVAVGPYLYAIGGRDAVPASRNDVWRARIRLDTDEPTWIDGTSGQQPGATLAAGTWRYWIAATFASNDATRPGSTGPIGEPVLVRVAGVSTGRTATLTWSPVPEASGYRIYRGSTAVPSAARSIATVTGIGSTTFTDTGLPASATAPTFDGTLYPWTSVPVAGHATQSVHLLQARDHASVTVTPDPADPTAALIVAAGGSQDGTALASVEVARVDGATGGGTQAMGQFVTSANPLSIARSRMPGWLLLPGEMPVGGVATPTLLVGNGLGAAGASTRVDLGTVDATGVTPVSTPPAPTPGLGSAGATARQTLWSVGGDVGGSGTAAIARGDCCWTWSTEPTAVLPGPRRYPGAAVVGGVLVAGGGYDNSNVASNLMRSYPL